jgi:two-component system KDP operon response regulator KdpE
MLSILFVEDDVTIAMGVEYSLKQDGYQVSLAHRLEDARDLLKRQPFDLVLLDIGLPDGSGYELCKEIRAAGDTPIIILSARDEEASIVLGLDLGADDYITKPFAMNELMARLRAAVRRGQEAAPELVDVRIGSLVIDLARKRVTRDGDDVRLTPTEWNFLELLARNLGKLVTREQLLREVWGPAYVGENHYLRVYAAQLRRKLEDDPARPRHLITSPGLGYTLEA